MGGRRGSSTVLMGDLCTILLELCDGSVDLALGGVGGEADEVLLSGDGGGRGEDGCEGAELHDGFRCCRFAVSLIGGVELCEP